MQEILNESQDSSHLGGRGEPDMPGHIETCDMTGKVLSLDPDGC